MAPDAPNQKRKRGRPPGASRIAGSATGPEPDEMPARPSPDSINSPSMSDAVPKRGRPRKHAEEDRPQEAPVATQPEQTESPPMAQKRGRRPKIHNTDPDEEETAVETRPSKRRKADRVDDSENRQHGVEKKGSADPRKAGAGATAAAAESEEPSLEGPRSRRGRNSRQTDDSSRRSAHRETETDNRRQEVAKGKTRRKPAAGDEQSLETQRAEESEPRRSRRERHSTEGKPWWTASQAPSEAGANKEAAKAKEPKAGKASGAKRASNAPAGPAKPRRGRPSLAELAVSNAQNQASPTQAEPAPKQGRGRPRASEQTESPAESAAAKPRKTHPKKPSKSRPSPATAAEQASPSSSDAATNPPPAPSTNPRHLTTLTRNIPRSTITSKWTPLDTPSINAISSLLTESTLPVLHRLRDRDARQAQAQSILRIFTARLRSKLVKGMPFPPPSVPAPIRGRGRGRGKKKGETAGPSHEAEFDFEKTVAAIAGLEKALDPLLHSVVLLRAEKEREEKALEREYEVLRRLEGNARAQVRGWRERGGKGREHVLAGGLGVGSGVGEGRAGALEVVSKVEEEGLGIFKDLQEEELLALSQQIGNHMESMRSNLSQIDGVLPAIAKTRAALQGTLCEHLDPEQYEQVLLG